MTAKELRNSILQLAIQGKLVKQNPKDEPVSVLLEKIKEEREKLIKEKKIKKEKYSKIYKKADKYYEEFEDGTIKDITGEIPFDIPESWRFTRFNNLVHYRMGKTPPREEKQYWKDNYNWVSIADMIDNGIVNNTKEKISNKAFEEKFSSLLSPKNTLIMSFKLTVGKVSILGKEALHNEAIISIFPYYDKEFITRNYLFKFLPLLSNYGKTKDAIKGKTLNSTSLNNLLIPLPPINEQKRIVANLDKFNTYIEKYDNIYNKLEALNNSYKEKLKKSILQYAIQGKLVKQNLNDEPASVLLEKIKEEREKLIKEKRIKKEKYSKIYKEKDKYYEEFEDGTINDITEEIPFEIIDTWKWIRLNSIMDVRDGTHDSPHYYSSGIPLITSKNLSENGLDLKNVKFISIEDSKKINERSNVDDGDILFAMIGSIGNPVIVKKEFEFSIKNMALFKNIYNININYIYNVLKIMQEKMKKDASGGVQKFVSLNYLRSFLIPFPPEKEQLRIVDKLSKIINKIETAE